MEPLFTKPGRTKNNEKPQDRESHLRQFIPNKISFENPKLRRPYSMITKIYCK